MEISLEQYNAMAERLTYLEQKLAESEWIPCEERWPELSEYVLATYFCTYEGNKEFRRVAIFSREYLPEEAEFKWCSDDEYGELYDYEVVAWMPLPKFNEEDET